MTKQDLIDQVVSKTKITREQVSSVLEASMSAIKTSVTGGEPVFLRGFGTFEPKRRKQKTGRNIGKGTAVIIPARSIPSFKPSAEFKNQVIEATTNE